MSKVLVIAEHDNQTLKSATLHVISAAQQISEEIVICIIGFQCEAVVEQAKQYAIHKIILLDNEVYQHQLAENCAQVVADLGKEYDYILTSATTFGKNLLPRAAALLDVGMISDVIQITSPDTFVRPIYAGNAIATVTSKDKHLLLTIRTTAFSSAKPKTGASVSVETSSIAIPNSLSEFKSQSLTESKRPELTSARVVVSGGRGLKSAENFQLLEALADRLGAAIGASRAAVDAGFAPNDYQVGQTGKVVAPDLYIAIGISGAIQHLAGMKDSKVIVAINNDPDAPIFQIADYALVGDLFKVLEELNEELSKVGV